MSKIPGFQGSSKLKAPTFKSKLAVPGSFGLQTLSTTKYAEVLTGEESHDKPGELDEFHTKQAPGMLTTTTVNRSGKQVKADGRTETSDVDSHLGTKDRKESRTRMQPVKRGVPSFQPRYSTAAGRGNSLHSQTPYAREAEGISKFGGRKISGPSSGLRKLVPRVPKAAEQDENLERNSIDQGNKAEVTKSIESKSDNAAGTSADNAKCRIPSASKLSKRGSASLHNLSSYPSAKQEEDACRTCWATSLNSSQSMQSLHENSVKERTSSFNKSSSKLRKFASTENFVGNFRKQGERSLSNSSLVHTQGSNKVRSKSVEQKSNIKIGKASRDADAQEMRKPSTLRIPTARPTNRTLAAPKPRKSLQVGHQPMGKSDDKGNKNVSDESNSSFFGKGVGYKREALANDCLLLSSMNDKLESDSLHRTAGPRQSTPLRKEAGHGLSFKSAHEEPKGESWNTEPSSGSLRGHIKQEKEGEATSRNGERQKTDGILEKTFNIDDQNDESKRKRQEKSEEECCLEERKCNATFSQTDQNLTGSVYQTVFFAHDDDLRDSNLHSTFCCEDHDEDLSHTTPAIREEANCTRLHLSSIRSPKPRTDQSPCTFDLYHVSPPHDDISSASLTLNSLQNVSLDEEVVVALPNDNERAGVPRNEIDSKFFESELITGGNDKTVETSQVKCRNTEENFERKVDGSSPSKTTSPLQRAEDAHSEKVADDLEGKDFHPVEKLGEMKLMDLNLYNGDVVDVDYKLKSMTLPLTRSRRALTVDPSGLSVSPRFKDSFGRRLNEMTSVGLILKPPSRNLVMLEDAVGNVILDKWSYIQLQHEIKAMKTAVLKLKRCLQEVDIASPLANTSLSLTLDRQHSASDAVRRSRLRPQSFSDGTNWASRSLEVMPLYTVDGFMKETSAEDHLGTPAADKQPEDGELIDRIIALEKMKDDLLLELDRKDNTIRLLQTQLEGKHLSEEKDELLEENIILHEEVSRLTGELNRMNSTARRQDWKSKEKVNRSLQHDFAKQLENQSPVKAVILKRMYSHE